MKWQVNKPDKVLIIPRKTNNILFTLQSLSPASSLTSNISVISNSN